MEKLKKIILFYFKILKNWIHSRKKNPLKSLGSHFITGYMGAGKTLLMSSLIDSVDNKKYFFLSNQKQFKQDNVYYFDLNKIFKEGKQVKQLPIIDNKGRKLYGVVFDEINYNFNRRNNRYKEYNEIFIPLINLIVSSRHQGLKRIYFIGQKIELQDTQLQSLFLYKHDIIYTKRRYYFKKYLETDKIEKYPCKLIILNQVKSDLDTYKTFSKVNYRIKLDTFNNYDTFILRKDFEHLVKLSI